MDYKIKTIIELCDVLKEHSVEYNIQKSDKSFKNLFEIKSQFIELLQTFIFEPWVNKITEENIELADKEFILSNFKERTADIVYRIKIDNKYLYFFLLELQSKPDKNMPYRLLEYMFEIWRRHHLDSPKEKLPIIIPCVLYTGHRKWKTTDFKSLFPKNKDFYKYIPNFEYILIDINRYSDEELEKISNLISSVFFVAKSKDELDAFYRIKKLKNIKKKDIEPFIKWCKIMFLGNNDVYEYIEENLNKEEDTMRLAEIGPKFVALCREDGLREGKLEGKLEAKQQSVLKILPKKLKQILPPELEKTIKNASLEKLEELEDKIFEINSLDDIINILN